jgi:hypothetical protein
LHVGVCRSNEILDAVFERVQWILDAYVVQCRCVGSFATRSIFQLRVQAYQWVQFVWLSLRLVSESYWSQGRLGLRVVLVSGSTWSQGRLGLRVDLVCGPD